ncbi:hypothetical protein SynROS8604_02165 [Synechococcus sp. ROS8604]|nr:hypothetical protein SynROS8604_02165 [Synechococcus sp. ROS8604]
MTQLDALTAAAALISGPVTTRHGVCACVELATVLEILHG